MMMRSVVKKLLKVSAPVAVLALGLISVKLLAEARPEPEKTEDSPGFRAHRRDV